MTTIWEIVFHDIYIGLVINKNNKEANYKP